MEKISVLIKGFRPEMLPNAIESVLNQTYKNIELLVGIETGQDELINSISSYSSNIIPIFMKARYQPYVYEAFERLFLRSTGDFVFFMSDDDVIHSDFIERCYNKIAKENLDIVYTYYNLLEGDRKERKETSEPNIAFSVFRSSSLKEIWNKYGNLFGNKRWTGDGILLNRLQSNYRIGKIYLPLIDIRKHEGQFTALKNKGGMRVLFEMLETRNITPPNKQYRDTYFQFIKYAFYMFREKIKQMSNINFSFIMILLLTMLYFGLVFA